MNSPPTQTNQVPITYFYVSRVQLNSCWFWAFPSLLLYNPPLHPYQKSTPSPYFPAYNNYIVPICFTIIIAQFLVLYLLHLISEFSYQEYAKVHEYLVAPSLAPHPKPWQIWTQLRFKCFKDFEHVPFIVISYENKLFADKNSYGVYFFLSNALLLLIFLCIALVCSFSR